MTLGRNDGNFQLTRQISVLPPQGKCMTSHAILHPLKWEKKLYSWFFHIFNHVPGLSSSEQNQDGATNCCNKHFPLKMIHKGFLWKSKNGKSTYHVVISFPKYRMVSVMAATLGEKGRCWWTEHHLAWLGPGARPARWRSGPFDHCKYSHLTKSFARHALW